MKISLINRQNMSILFIRITISKQKAK